MTENLFVAQDEPAFLKKAAQLVVEMLVQAVEKRGRATWSLAGGNTPKKIYALLADSYYRERIPWKNVVVCWGDERCVSPDHADSNYKMAMDALLSKVPIPQSNIHRMAGEMTSAQDAAKAYEQDLQLLFKMDRPFPKFDLMLLGLGEDGHIASLFPSTSAVLEQMRWVVGHRVEKLGGDRMTLTLPVINNARRILFLCSGEAKATIVKEVLRDDGQAASRYPAQRVNPADGDLIWLLDSPAASKLPAAKKLTAQNI